MASGSYRSGITRICRDTGKSLYRRQRALSTVRVKSWVAVFGAVSGDDDLASAEESRRRSGGNARCNSRSR